MCETWALVPLKNLDRAKLRLAPALNEKLRRSLVLAMARDVLNALEESSLIAKILLVSSESEAGRMLKGDKLDVFYSNPHEGMNRELEQAASYAAANGAERVLIVHGDLPLLNTQVIDQFILNTPLSDIRAASCKNNSGTNALLAPLPLGIRLKFGRNSLQRFKTEVAEQQLQLEVEDDQRLGMDIDVPDDLCILQEQNDGMPDPGPATMAFLRNHATTSYRRGGPHTASQARRVKGQETPDAKM